MANRRPMRLTEWDELTQQVLLFLFAFPAILAEQQCLNTDSFVCMRNKSCRELTVSVQPAVVLSCFTSVLKAHFHGPAVCDQHASIYHQAWVKDQPSSVSFGRSVYRSSCFALNPFSSVHTVTSSAGVISGAEHMWESPCLPAAEAGGGLSCPLSLQGTGWCNTLGLAVIWKGSGRCSFPWQETTRPDCKWDGERNTCSF